MLNEFILILIGFSGAVITFYVNEGIRQGPVRASALLSFAVTLVIRSNVLNLAPYLLQNIPLVFIGSSFIGMVSSRLISNYCTIGAAGVIFCIIFLNTSRFFHGFGGALGTSACISLLIILSIPIVTKKHRITNGFALFRKTLFGTKSE
ncbi:hypothetical protein [Flavobacterium fluviale]|uniref:hypothetical protein n=1 Tax=Flavobacterium fluviale TaxID=2249356 RepID=UPI0019660984|nr:hypothetical protein [Flavobacterium fluviale]